MILGTKDKNSEEMNTVDAEENTDHDSKTLKVVKQSEKLPNTLFSSAQRVKTLFCNVFHLFAKLPFLLYSSYGQWKQEIYDDYISI